MVATSIREHLWGAESFAHSLTSQIALEHAIRTREEGFPTVMEIVRRGATPQNLLRVLVLVAKTASAHHCGVALHAHAVSHKLEEAAITMDQVREIAATEPRPLSLRQMRTFADAGAKVRLMSAQFLHQELQSRFAR